MTEHQLRLPTAFDLWIIASRRAAFVADFIARASTTGLDLACARASSAPRFVVP